MKNRFNKGEKAYYRGMLANILDVDLSDYPRLKPTYKIEVEKTCIQRFWVQERELMTII